MLSILWCHEPLAYLLCETCMPWGWMKNLGFWQETFPDWYSFTKEKSGIYMTNQFCKVFRNIWKGPQLQSYGQWFTQWSMAFNYPVFKICILAVSVNRSQKMHLVFPISDLTIWFMGHLVHRTLFTLLIQEYGGEMGGGNMLRCSNNSSSTWWWESAYWQPSETLILRWSRNWR